MKRLTAILTLALALAIPGLCQDFSANLYEWYGEPCLTQPNQFSPQYGIRFNTGGWAYPGLYPPCGTPVPQRQLDKDNYKADVIWNAQFGSNAPQSIHDQINNGPQIDYGAAIDAIWGQAKQNMVGCVGSAALNTGPPTYIKIQKTLWQYNPGLFTAGQTFQDGTIWCVNFYISNGTGFVSYATNSNNPTASTGTLLEWEFDNWIYYQVTGRFQESLCHP